MNNFRGSNRTRRDEPYGHERAAKVVPARIPDEPAYLQQCNWSTVRELAPYRDIQNRAEQVSVASEIAGIKRYLFDQADNPI